MKNNRLMTLSLGAILCSMNNPLVASPGPLFTVQANAGTMTVTPTLNRYYPSMGVKLTSGHTVSGCQMDSNGYCIFDASKENPKVLTLAGEGTAIQGTVCLNGPAQYSC